MAANTCLPAYLCIVAHMLRLVRMSAQALLRSLVAHSLLEGQCQCTYLLVLTLELVAFTLPQWPTRVCHMLCDCAQYDLEAA